MEQKLHPPLVVSGYIDGGVKNRDFEIGNGRHGPFKFSTYADFSENGDVSQKVIRLNTDSWPVLEVSTFELLSDWTLRPVGTKPLIIRSLGNVNIAGLIDCSGAPGEAMNGIPSAITQGGQGRCGGGNGGSGGSMTLAAQAGLNGGPVIPNGAGPGVDGPTPGGGATLFQSGGGGGGAYAVARGGAFDPSSGSGPGGGSVGQMGEDNDFDIQGGGFGGGGGAAFIAGGLGQNSAGGGGGGGGGHVFITSGGNITITGAVLAEGGDGGSSNGSYLAGGGGGGGGGSIAMFAKGEVIIDGALALVSADRGSGGGSPANAGGNGSAGRTWLVDGTGYSDNINGAPVEYPDPLVADVGSVLFQTGSFTATSEVLDLQNSRPVLVSSSQTSVLPGASTLLIEVASGESSDFSPLSWSDVLSAPLTMDRYFRLRVTISSTDLVTPAELSGVQFHFVGFEQETFEFVGACGRLLSTGSGTHSQPLWIWLILLFPPLMTRIFFIPSERPKI